MRVDALERLRRENPVPDALPAPPIEPLWRRLDEPLATEPELPGRGRGSERSRRPNPGGWVGGVLTAVVLAMTLVIGAGALILLSGHQRSAPNGRTTGATPPGRQELISILGVLRRPQTKVDRNAAVLAGLSARGQPMGMQGTPDVPLVRFATTTPWGEKLYLVPMKPLTAEQDPSLASRFRAPSPGGSGRGAHGETLSVIDSQGGNLGGITAASIKAGTASNTESAGPGASTVTRLFIVVPDGVARVEFVLPREPQFVMHGTPVAPGTPVYPRVLSVTAPVNNNMATLQADRVTGGAIPMIWYRADGRVIRRIGDFAAANRVIAPPQPGPETPLSRAAERNPSTPNPVSVTPPTGRTHTTFSVHFRLLLNGAGYRYTLSGPHCAGRFHGGFIGGIRGRTWSQSLTYPGQAWCPGTYHLSVSVNDLGPAGNLKHPAHPFGSATFTVHP